jgi:hypothetical protein
VKDQVEENEKELAEEKERELAQTDEVKEQVEEKRK